jgi:radical SAM superfamily enzyme YgiQ (UPF0313 family)
MDIKGVPGTDQFLEKNPMWDALHWVEDMKMELGEETTNQYLWAYVLMHHPQSPLFDMPLYEKEDYINKLQMSRGKQLYYWNGEECTDAEKKDRDVYEKYELKAMKHFMNKEMYIYKIWENGFEKLTLSVQQFDYTSSKDRNEFMKLSDGLDKVRMKIENYGKIMDGRGMAGDEKKGVAQGLSDTGALFED